MAHLWLENGYMRGWAAGGTNTARTGKPGRTPHPPPTKGTSQQAVAKEDTLCPNGRQEDRWHC